MDTNKKENLRTIPEGQLILTRAENNSGLERGRIVRPILRRVNIGPERSRLHVSTHKIH